MNYNVTIMTDDYYTQVEADSKEEAMDMAIEEFLDGHGLCHDCCDCQAEPEEAWEKEPNYKVVIEDSDEEKYHYEVYAENEEDAQAKATELYGLDDIQDIYFEDWKKETQQ